MAQTSFNQGANMTAGSKGGYRGPDTRAPGGGGMDYNGNPVGGGMGAQFNFGGPRMIGGAYGQPIFGGRPNPGDLYRPPVGGADPGFNAPMPQPGPGRFQPRGMIPPAGGRIGNPRQVNPGQGPMQPGMPVQPPSFGGGKGGFQGPMTTNAIQEDEFRNY